MGKKRGCWWFLGSFTVDAIDAYLHKREVKARNTGPFCPACRCGLSRLSNRWARQCVNCAGLWVDGSHQKEVMPERLRRKKKDARIPGIARGDRACPRCALILEPGDGVETCLRCLGRFYEAPQT